MVVVPCSVKEFIANFMNGKFSLHKFWETEIKGKNITSIPLSDKIPGDMKEGFDQRPALHYRFCKGTLPVSGVPLVSEALVTYHSMVYESTDTTYRVKNITRTEGTPASPDRCQTLDALELCAVDPRSH